MPPPLPPNDTANDKGTAADAQRRIAHEAAERERLERALTESEARMKLALVAARMATWSWDPETDALSASDTITEMLGLPLRTCAEFLQLLQPAHREHHRELIETSLREETGWRTEFSLVRPSDQQLIWLEQRAEVMRDPETGKLFVTGIIWNITERKRADLALRASQERLNLLIENAREYAIISLDLERRITSWNSGAQLILGYAAEEVLGQSGDIIFTPEDRAAGVPAQETQRALAEGRASDERWHLRKDGTLFWGSGVMALMRDAAGAAIGFVKIFRDQTAEKRAEEEVRRSRADLQKALAETDQARQEAEAANRAKDQFLAALSHELRTPLTPVLMSVESLLPRQDLPERVRQALEMIHRNIRTETHFIDDLLDISRIRHGRLQLASEHLDVHEALRRALEICRADISEKCQTLEVELKAQRTETIGDSARLQQVFWNLLKNASKFTPSGGNIGVRSWNDTETALTIEVWDTGRGIDPAHLGEIFDVFRQEDSNIAPRFGGLGLGLAIAKAAVVGHGGTIRASSRGSGHGATFTVTLPLPAPNLGVQP